MEHDIRGETMKAKIVTETEDLDVYLPAGIHLWGNTLLVGFSQVAETGELVLCTMTPAGRVRVMSNKDVIYDSEGE